MIIDGFKIFYVLMEYITFCNIHSKQNIYSIHNIDIQW